MRLFTSTLMAGLLLTSSVNAIDSFHPTANSMQVLSQQAPAINSIQQRSRPKHRGSGRRELLGYVEISLG